MDREDNPALDEIIDLGTASVVTQGMGAGATDQNGQPKNLIGGISDD